MLSEQDEGKWKGKVWYGMVWYGMVVDQFPPFLFPSR